MSVLARALSDTVLESQKKTIIVKLRMFHTQNLN